MVSRIVRAVAELLAPPLCPVCGTSVDEGRELCPHCLRLLPPPPEEALPGGLDSLFACTAYASPVEDWIQRFKYPEAGLAGIDPAPAARIAALARRTAAACTAPPPDAVVPVPLHRTRLRARGFNPAASIAREIAGERSLPLSARALCRVRETQVQAGLDRRARIANVRDAFEAPSVAPKRVWLIDDVSTTGATLDACAVALRRAGAERVDGICLARTPSPAGPAADAALARTRAKGYSPES